MAVLSTGTGEIPSDKVVVLQGLARIGQLSDEMHKGAGISILATVSVYRAFPRSKDGKQTH